MELLVLAIVAGAIWYLRKRSTTAPAAGAAGATGNWYEKKSARVVGLLVGLTILVLFWDTIADALVSFFVQSDAGVATGVAENEHAKTFIRTWLWVIPLATAWFVWKTRQPEKKKGPFSTASDNIALVMLGLPFLAVSAIVVLLVGFPILGLIDWGTGGEVNKYWMRTQALVTGQEYVEPVKVVTPDNCDTTETLNYAADRNGNRVRRDLIINPQGTVINVCSTSGTIYVFGEFGAMLSTYWVERWYKENEQLLRNRSLYDFFEFNMPGTYPGSLATSWRIVPKPDAFRQAGIDSIPIFVFEMPPG